MQLIIDLTSHDKPDATASGRMILLPQRKVLYLAGALFVAVSLAMSAAAYFLAAYWVESGSPIVHKLQADHATRQQVGQTQAWQGELEALHGELATLNARVLELYSRGEILSERVGLPGAQLFTLSEAGAQAPLQCDRNAGVGTLSPATTQARILAHLQQQDDALQTLERNYAIVKQQAIHNNLLSATLPLRRPVVGKNWLSSAYGYRSDPFTGRRAFHAGDDYAAQRGTPIVAAAEGLITYAGRLGRYGNTVKIKHGGGISTLYGHMYKIHVQPGQHVRKGEVIGSVGSTGRSTAPHLHYEVRVNNRPASPRRTIKKLRQARLLQQPTI